MLVGQLSKLTGFSKDTIRYYEKIGLIEKPFRNSKSGYKEYSISVYQRLLSIKRLKAYGFTLEEIREILVLRDISAIDEHKTIQLIEQKIVHLEIQIDQMLQYKNRLLVAKARAANNLLEFELVYPEISMCA